MTEKPNLRRLTAELPLGAGAQDVRRRIDMFEHVLERSFTLPLINRPVGLDAIVGLVPVAGDLIAGVMGLYLVWEARNLGLPKWKIWRMLANVGVDTVLGSVPLVGDLFDVMFRSNTTNLKIIRRHLDRHHPETQIISG
ncbi:MAG: DUF4112 domain-containing protein [Novosphingobium sp.]